MPVDVSELVTLLGVFAVAAIVPGPDFAFVVRESVVHGRRAGISAAFGVACALLVHASYTVLGIGLIVAQSVVAFTIVKWLGAGYLLFLGIAAFTARPAAPAGLVIEREAVPARPGGHSFGLGFLTNLLNPKAALFFVSLFTAIVSHETPLVVQAGYGAAMAVLLAAWFSLVAFLFTTPSMRAGFLRLGRWFDRLTGLLFIALGIRLALQRAT